MKLSCTYHYLHFLFHFWNSLVSQCLFYSSLHIVCHPCFPFFFCEIFSKFFLVGLALSPLTPNNLTRIMTFDWLCFIMGIPLFEHLLHCFHNLMINKYDPRRVDLVGWRIFIVTQGFTDKPHGWKWDFVFARCSDLCHDDLIGTYMPWTTSKQCIQRWTQLGSSLLAIVLVTTASLVLLIKVWQTPGTLFDGRWTEEGHLCGDFSSVFLIIIFVIFWP